jgi:hypothetical protein
MKYCCIACGAQRVMNLSWRNQLLHEDTTVSTKIDEKCHKLSYIQYTETHEILIYPENAWIHLGSWTEKLPPPHPEPTMQLVNVYKISRSGSTHNIQALLKAWFFYLHRKWRCHDKFTDYIYLDGLNVDLWTSWMLICTPSLPTLAYRVIYWNWNK